MKHKRLKLYVWKGFSPDYTDGLAVAIASSEEEACKMVQEDYGPDIGTWGTLEVHPLSRRFVAQVSGGA